jgi:DUF971 family protein
MASSGNKAALAKGRANLQAPLGTDAGWKGGPVQCGMAAPHPVQLTLRKPTRVLEVAFDDGQVYSLPFEYLRTHSPSAEVQGHGGPMQLVLGKETVGVTRIEPIGQYAVRLVFDDGHDSGLFTWKYLYELGLERPSKWAEYEKRRQAALSAAQ